MTEESINKTQKLLIALLFFISITDLTIILNIPYLRQILGFLCFTIIPGLLIIHILKLNEIGFVKKFVLSIGLSIAFLMLVGLLLNQLYLVMGVSKPLSTHSLVVSFTIILVTLVFIAYKKNKDDFATAGILDINFYLKNDQLISPLFFPIIFPFLAVLGTHLMNTEGNNLILMLTYFLIPIYIVLVVYFRERIPKVVYPIAILMISMALLLMYGLTSNYLCGRDVHAEYRAFMIVASYQYWSMSNYLNVLTACLSTSLLPAIYKSLLGINGLYVYKVVFQLIGSIIPLVCYILFKRYVGELYAFLASFFFMAQGNFLFYIQSTMRQEIALLFFALAMMVSFDDEIGKLNKKILFFIFMVSMILSHYTVAYVFFFLISFSWLLMVSLKNFFKSRNNITAVVVMLCFAIIFFWYSQITTTPFNQGVHFVDDTFSSLVEVYVLEARAETPLRVLGMGMQTLGDKITTVVHDIGFAFIIIGVIGALIKYKETKIEKEYLLLMLLCFGLLASLFIVPYLAKGYGSGRLYQQLLVILAPAFILGGIFIFKYIRPRIGLIVIIIVLISQFFCASYVLHQVLSIPYSEVLNRDGDKSGELYIYGQEVVGANWLKDNGANNSDIYSDRVGGTRLSVVYEVGKPPKVHAGFFRINETINGGYIYLRHTNVVDREVYPTSNYEDIKPMTEYVHLFVGMSRIYDNGGSEVWE